MNAISPDELMPPTAELLRRYHELRRYVELTDEDIQRCVAGWPIIRPFVPALIDDFYAEILRHGDTSAAMTGGPQQVERLKVSLTHWLTELFAGKYDEEFVRNRWIVGWRHVRIGLAQVWASTAMSRLKNQILLHVGRSWESSVVEFQQHASAISRMMDLDLTLIQDAYHMEAVADFVQTEREFNEAIIGTTQAIVLVVDARAHGKIIRGNRYLAQLVGNSDTLPSHVATIHDLIPADDQLGIEALFQSECFDEPSGPVVTRFIGYESRERTIRWFARTVPHPQCSLPQPNEEQAGMHRCQLLVGHDITDLVEAQRRDVQQERLAAIGQTMAGLAHESRNAFQRSQAALETLALDLEDKPDSLELVGRIQRANDHLLHLYQEVLQFAKPVRLELRSCHVIDIANTTCQHIVQVGLCTADRLQIELDARVQPITMDPFAVEQILRNLMENAIVVSPENEPVRITIASAWQGDAPAVRVEIRDRGPGISEEYQDRIFEPFFSTRSRGTGLGLPIARRLAEAHGGRLKLDSSVFGTTAVLELPETPYREPTEDPENQPDPRRSQPAQPQ